MVGGIESGRRRRRRIFAREGAPRGCRCGSDAWTMTPSGMRGVLNDAISIYFAMLASAFVARWGVGSKVEMAGGVFQIRGEEPVPRVGAGLHRTP